MNLKTLPDNAYITSHQNSRNSCLVVYIKNEFVAFMKIRAVTVPINTKISWPLLPPIKITPK